MRQLFDTRPLVGQQRREVKRELYDIMEQKSTLFEEERMRRTVKKFEDIYIEGNGNIESADKSINKGIVKVYASRIQWYRYDQRITRPMM